MAQAKNKSGKAKTRKRYKNGQINEKPEYLDPPEKASPELSAGSSATEQNRNQSVIFAVIGILITMLAVVPGSSGWRGTHNFLLGLFGQGIVLVPCINFYLSAKAHKGMIQFDLSRRVMWGAGFVVIVCTAIQIFEKGSIPGVGFWNRISAIFHQGASFRGGGVMSLPLGALLLWALGKTGARIITVLGIFTFLLLMSGKDIVGFLEMLASPFKWLGKTLDGIHSVIMGGDFDYGFEGRDDMEDEDVELPPERSVPDNFFSDTPSPVQERSDVMPELDTDLLYEDDPDYIADAEAFAMIGAAPPPRRRRRRKSAVKSAYGNNGLDVPLTIDVSGDNSGDPVDDALELLISRAAGEEPEPSPEPIEAAPAEEVPEEPEIPQEPELPAAPLYILPSLELLTLPDKNANSKAAIDEMNEKAQTILNTLQSFGVKVTIQNVCRGPSITRYDVQPGAGVKVSKIRGLEDDIALSLAAQGVRIAPVPGQSAVGIEVPNIHKDTVTLREILSSNEFRNSSSKLTFAVGKDIAGNSVVGDITRMPHVIIAGTTGSGKSVCTRSIIMSILYNAKPDEVKIILIDPKIVEFKVFEGIPHLLIPIVTEAKKAAGALNWAVNEMMRRYNIFADAGANDLKSYNELADEDDETTPMPQIVIFIDELADMMLVAKNEVEDYICRLAQMGRAAGMHLVVATQRPTTDVITGLIKANIPSRIALSVMSQVDSRTIIDMGGADKLLGNGDMLYMPIGMGKPLRVQGCFASTKDINETLKFIKAQLSSEYDNDIIQAVENFVPQSKGGDRDSGGEGNVEAGSDEDYILRAAEVAVNAGQLSTSMLQRKLKLGYARAARIMDELEDMGIVGASEGAKPRKVLMSKMQFDDWKIRRMGD